MLMPKFFSNVRRFLVLLCFYCGMASISYGQIGGRNAFGFTSMAFEPHVSSLGGMVLGQTTTSMSGMDFPSALQNGQKEVNIGYTSLYGSSSAFAVQYIMPHKRFGVLQVGTRYLTHGLLDRRDALNTYQGKFSANEVDLYAGAAFTWENYRFGVNVHGLIGQLEAQNSLGLAVDFTAFWEDSSGLTTMGFALRNLGGEIIPYAGKRRATPTDLQFGFSRKLKYLPLRIHCTLHDLYRWNLRFEDSLSSNSSNLFGLPEDQSVGGFGKFTDNFFRHVNFGLDFNLFQDKFWFALGYNHQRRMEMAIPNRNGFAGFSLGFGMELNRWAFGYSYAKHHLASGFHGIRTTLRFHKKAKNSVEN